MTRVALRLCKCCGEFHDRLKPWPHNCISHFGPDNRSKLPSPYFISDTMDALESPVSGRFFDSKSQLRAEYKREGVIELGNERAKPRDNDIRSEGEMADSIAQAWNELSP